MDPLTIGEISFLGSSLVFAISICNFWPWPLCNMSWYFQSCQTIWSSIVCPFDKYKYPWFKNHFAPRVNISFKSNHRKNGTDSFHEIFLHYQRFNRKYLTIEKKKSDLEEEWEFLESFVWKPFMHNGSTFHSRAKSSLV